MRHLEARSQIPRYSAVMEDWEDSALYAKLSHTLSNSNNCSVPHVDCAAQAITQVNHHVQEAQQATLAARLES